MRKIYKKPTIRTVAIALVQMLAESGVTSEKGIGYGGIDEENEKEAASRMKHRNVWGDEDE